MRSVCFPETEELGWHYRAFCTSCGRSEYMPEPMGYCFDGEMCPRCGTPAYEDPRDPDTFLFTIQICRVRYASSWWKPWTWGRTVMDKRKIVPVRKLHECRVSDGANDRIMLLEQTIRDWSGGNGNGQS